MLGYIFDNSNELQGQNKTDSPVFSGKSALVARRGIEHFPFVSVNFR